MLSDDDVLRNLAANVQRLLAAREWSQQQLSRATGEDPMTISRIIRGKNMPGTGVIARVAEAFDVSIDRLTGTPPEQNAEIHEFSAKSA